MTNGGHGLDLQGYGAWGGTDPQTQADEETLTGIAYRPTLIVGLGGTGLTVVQKLRRRVRKFFPDEDRDVFQFLVFDTMPQQSSRNLERLPEREFYYLGGVDGDGLISRLERFPLLEAWWPHRDYYPGFISDGAGAVRSVGRLALFQKIDIVHGALQGAVASAVEVSAGRLTDRPIKGEKAKVYIICSLCGGTGSGLFLDMAYLARSALQAQGMEVSVSGILVMPEAFYSINRSPAQQSWWRANAYAALKELDHYMTTRRFYTQYAPFIQVDQTKRPFDICYLVGSTNERGHVLQQYDGVTEMVAEEIFTEIVSPVGDLAVAVFDDIESVQGVSRDGKPAAYSSFSIASLVFLAADLAGYCASRNLIGFVDDVLLASPTDLESRSAEMVDQFVTNQRLREKGYDDLIDYLGTGNDGRPLGGLDVFTDELRVPHSELMDTVAAIEEDRRGLLAQHEATMKKRRLEKLATVGEALKLELVNIITDPEKGLTSAARFLDVLAAQLEAYRVQEMKAEEKAWLGEIAQYGRLGAAPSEDTDLGYAKLRLSEALGSNVIGRSRRVNRGISDYSAACTSVIRAQYELQRRSQGAQFYTDLAQEIERMSRLVNTVTATLRTEQNGFRRNAERFVRSNRFMTGEYVLAMGVVDEGQLEDLYHKYLLPTETGDNRRDAFQLFLAHFRGDAEEKALTLEDLAADDGLAICRGLFAFLQLRFASAFAELDVLSVIKNIADEDQLEIYVANLFNRAVPFWNWDPTEIFGGTVSVQSVNAIGIGEREWAEQVLEHLQADFTTVETRDRHAITMLRTSHGLPLHALRALARQGGYYNAYNIFLDQWREIANKQNTRPLHLSKILESEIPDIHPREHMEDYELFAVGMVMGYIYERGNWYFVQPIQVEGERARDPYQLQHGLREALEVFVRHPEAIRAVRKRTQDRFISEGRDVVAEVLRQGRDDFFTKSQIPGARRDLYGEMMGWLEKYCLRFGISLPPPPSLEGPAS